MKPITDPIKSLFSSNATAAMREVAALAQGHPRFLEVIDISSETLGRSASVSKLLDASVMRVPPGYRAVKTLIMFHAMKREFKSRDEDIEPGFQYQEAIRRGYYFNDDSTEETMQYIAEIKH